MMRAEVAVAYEFDFTADAHEEVVRVVRELAAEVRSQLDRSADPSTVGEAIHDTRRRCKELRALLRLVRPIAPTLARTQNRVVRDAARLVGHLRDADVVVETFDALIGEAVDPVDFDVRAKLVERRDALFDVDAATSHLVRAAELVATAATRVAADLPAFAWPDLSDGFAHWYGRAREQGAVAVAAPTVEAFHDWRKRVKDHRYHVALLNQLDATAHTAWEADLHALSDALGEDHDLAVLAGILASDFGGSDARIGPQRAARQRIAFELGARLFAAEPDAVRERAHAQLGAVS